MIDRKSLPFYALILAALVWPSVAAAVQPGVLTASATAKPERIRPQGSTQITVIALDGFKQPIPAASVKITADTGWFGETNRTTVFGFTGKDGVFQAVWHANQQTKPGTQPFEVTASKNGYVSKYPQTATAKVTVEDSSSTGDAQPQDGSGEPTESPEQER